MTPERRAEIVGILEESGAEFRASALAFPSDRAEWSPRPDCWSVLQIVEHVALAENGMFARLGAAVKVEASTENPAKEAIISTRLVSRETPVQAPERVRPVGRFTNVAEALAQFDEARRRTVRFAFETELDLFCLEAMHPLIGAVNCMELLLIMAGHSRRHAAQIAELRRHLEPDTAPRG